MGGHNAFVFHLAFTVALGVSQSPYDCTFESNYCSWTQDISDTLDWSRIQGATENFTTRPLIDHTFGSSNGWYIYIETLEDSDGKAGLISAQIPANSPYCLEFWYYMYGTHVDQLSIYVRQRDGSLGALLWTKSQSQGNQWNYGQVEIASSSSPFHIVFEAVHGLFFLGDIGLDDIKAVAGSCVGTNGVTCDFEDGLCGWNQTTEDDFDWTLHSGLTSTTDTGPSNDHTLDTSAGHYLYIETSAPQHPGQKARLVSSQVTQTTPQCLKFFYNLHGNNIGALNIYVMTGFHLSSNDAPVWSKRDDLGDIWVPGQTTIQGSSPYKIVFEGVVGAGDLGDIAIDDIILQNGSCSHAANNDFEHGFGAWTNPSMGDHVDWIIGQGSTDTAFHVPSTDHTLGTSQGHYVFFETAVPGWYGDTAWLQSPVLEPSAALCMTFWFVLYEEDVDYYLNIWMYPTTATMNSATHVWSLFTDHGQEWNSGQAGFSSSQPFYVIFEAVRGYAQAAIAIDDITFAEFPCGVSPIEADAGYLPTSSIAPPDTLTTSAPSPYDCNFEKDFCQWTQDTSDDLDWTRNVGPTSSQFMGPLFDHSFGNSTGHYIYIETSEPRHPNDYARLLSPQLNISPQGACLWFWYHMYGPSISSLNVYIQTASSHIKAWTRTGTQGNQWLYGEVPITGYAQCQLIIEATRGISYIGDIAIDDIGYSNKACTHATTSSSCDFEDSTLCGFTQDKNDSFDWTWNNGETVTGLTGPSSDHTEGTTAGHYMYIESSAPRQPGDRARLVSPTYLPSTGSCLTFYYNMYGLTMGTLKVYLAGIGPAAPFQILFQTSGNQGKNWLMAEAEVESPTNFSIYFDGIVGSKYYSDLAVDDITLHAGSCQGDASLLYSFLETTTLQCASDSGACDFESGLCTWVNVRDIDQFDWLIGQGLIGGPFTGPESDHTRLNEEGHYLFIEASRPQLPGQMAIIQSQTFDATSSRCITFWYHMKGNGIGTLSVVLFMTRSNLSTILWSLSDNQQDQWLFATAPINSHAERYQLQIQGTVGSNFLGDIAIDDIIFKPSTCTVSPQNADPSTQTTVTASPTSRSTPAFISAPTIYDCNFERDYCKWQQSVDDIVNWTRTQGPYGSQSAGPISDHTLGTGQGWYIFIAPSDTYHQNDSARLVSAQITDNTPCCLSFYYHMFGANVNLLNVYTKSSGQLGPGNLIWQRQGTQGLQWLHAMIELKYTVPYQIIFEGVPGKGFSGDISVDDVAVPVGSCMEVIAKSATSSTCDFESSLHPLCDFTQDTTDVFDWTLSSGSTSTTGTGTFPDHTYSTLAGHYLYTESSAPRQTNDTARLISKVFNTSDDNQHCLRFYYHMHGGGIGTLNVYALAQNQHPLPVWTCSADQGNQWKEAEVTITTIHIFQVIFEGVIGSNNLEDIAIDDISVLDGACPDTSSCNFDTDLCLWTNVHDGRDKFDWLRLQGSSDSQYVGPYIDHTQGKTSGYYIFMDTNPSQIPGDNARLKSQVIPASPGHEYCFSFWFYVHGDRTSVNWNKLTIYILTNASHDSMSSEADLLDITGDFGDVWNSGHVNISTVYTQKPFQIILEGIVGLDYRGQIAIDDTAIVPGDCPMQPAYTGRSETMKVYCNFDDNFCSWKQSTADNFDWTLSSQSTPVEGTGPSRDHSGTGAYVYLESSTPQKMGDRADLISSVMSPAFGPWCFSFWYHMYGPNIGSLSVYAIIHDQQSLQWTRSGTQGDQWKSAQLTMNSVVDFQIIVRGTVEGQQGDIALDDFFYTNGVCPVSDGNVCDFERDMCGYKQLASHLQWVYTTHTDHPGLPMDHTTGSETGHYITISGSGGANDVASVLSPTYAVSSGECLQFYYHLHGNNGGSLKVQLHVSAGTSVIWQAQGERGDQWKKAQVTLQTNTSYQISFDGQMGPGSGDVSVDDITILPYPCPLPGSCDFESGFCSFTNSHKDQFDWIRGFGATTSQFTGPSTDHTTGTTEGYYIFIESSNNRPGDRAQLLSETLDPTLASCLVFFYNMNGAGMGSLSVYQSTNSSQKLIFTQTGHHGDVWLQGSADLASATPYTVIFEGVKGANYTSDIALDDISVAPGTCLHQSKSTVVTTPTPLPSLSGLSCDFETDFCQWTQDTNDQFDWTRQHGETLTSNSGPSFDHTKGNIQGYYVYIEASQHTANDSARLRSPTFGSLGSTCVTFWYNMYGADVNQLNLYLGNPGQLGTQVWTKSGNQGFMWQYADIEIKPVFSAQLIFEALCGKRYMGDIALDDIIILNGPCPSQGFCDFEDAQMCGFVQSLDDQFDWTLMSGQNVTANSGPTKDHTYGTAQGHYMFMESASPQVTDDKARMLSKPYNPTTGSCLSFWYYMNGNSYMVGTLSVIIAPVGQQAQQPLWTRAGIQGSQWLLGTFNIQSIEKFQIMFEGTVGDFPSGGGIALDDIHVTPTGCTGLADCDFEQGGICSWIQSKNDSFDWIVNSGETGSLNTGPSTDHTTGTQSGDYIYIESSSLQHPGDTAVLKSQVIHQHGISDYCFTFWYHMWGSTIGTLNVTYTVPPLDPVTVFSCSGNQGNTWIEGFADISQAYGDITIYVIGSKGNGYQGDIALDDFKLYPYNCSLVKLSITSSSLFMCKDASNTTVTQDKVCNFIRDCPLPYLDEANCGDCDFQDGTCQWTDDSTGIWQWTLVSGQSHVNYSAPMYDYSGSPTDNFLCLVRSLGTNASISDLYSIQFGPCSSTCQMQIYYFISGQDSQLKVLLEQGEEMSLLWAVRGQETAKWVQATVDILRVSTSFRVHLQGYSYSVDAIVAVDDVQFINCNFPVPGNCDNSQSQFHCKSTACIPMAAVCDFTDDCGDGSDEASCDTYSSRTDFEESLNSWYNDHSGSDNFDWTRSHGSTSTSGTGPSRDHSRGTSTGYYVYIESSVPRKPGDKAWLVSTNAFNSTLGSKCVLRFYYHMYGATIGSLNVYTRSSLLGGLKEILSLSGNYGDAWMRKDVTLHETKEFQIVLEGVVGNGYQGDIGIDDISMTPDCEVSTEPFPTGSPPPPTVPGPCSANQFACDGNRCIPQSGVCDFQQQCSDGSDELMCGKCTFEVNLCGWRDHSTGQFAWVRVPSNDSALTGGPSSDANGLVGGGQYMLVQPTLGVTKDRARLVSPVFNAAGTKCQMSFKYYISDDSTGSLMVLLQKASDIGTDNGVGLWHHIGNVGNTWQFYTVDIGQIDYPFVITFTSLPSLQFGTCDVAVDNIDLKDCKAGQIANSTANGRDTGCSSDKYTCGNGVCINSEKKCDAANDCGDENASDEKDPSCANYLRFNFESSSFGEFTQDHSGIEDKTDWQIGQASSMSFSGLPDADHTTGKSSGHFLFVRSHNPGDTAWLISRPFGATAGQNCQMKLFFYIFGSSVNHLSILYRTHNAGPPDGQIWTSAGQQGPNWLEALPLISIATPFQIIIEAYVAMANQAIAIDDMSFTPDCRHSVTNLPPLSSTSLSSKPMTSTTSTSNPLPMVCKNAELMCDNQQQCYAKAKLCDNKIDCVDGSDEAKSKCTCHSHLCFNGGQCSVKAGAGPTCNCVKNYSGLDCKTPPAASGIGINTTPSGQQDNSSNSTKKWAIPVGVILGLLAIGATVGGVLVFRRRNGGLKQMMALPIQCMITTQGTLIPTLANYSDQLSNTLMTLG